VGERLKLRSCSAPLCTLAIVGVGLSFVWSQDGAIARVSTFQIGIYLDVATSEALREVRAAGFDVVWLHASEALLDDAGREGLKVIAYLSGNDREGNRLDLERLKGQIQRYRSHPAIVAWDVVDEPDVWKVPPEQMGQAYELVKKLDPARPVYTVVARPNSYRLFASATDLLAVDCYPVPRSSVEDVAGCVSQARSAKSGSPVVAVIQAFRPPTGAEREPSPKEVRLMTYLAIASGAKSLLYYTYGYGGIPGVRSSWTMPRDSRLLWQELLKLVQEVRRLAPIVQESVASSELACASRAVTAIAAGDGLHYVIAINSTDRILNVRCASRNGREIEEGRSIFRDERLTPLHREIAFSLDPSDVGVYSVRFAQ